MSSISAAGEPRVGACILAAGQSTRMGRRNKLLIPIEGVPMVARVASRVCGAGSRPVVLVTGHEAADVGAAVKDLPVQLVHNPSFADGMSSSLRVGIQALEDRVDGILICLGDMPWVRTEHIEALLAAFDPSGSKPIVAPFVAGRRGHPVLWPAAYFGDLLQLEGDAGARRLLEREATRVTAVSLEDPGVTRDLDTLADLDALD